MSTNYREIRQAVDMLNAREDELNDARKRLDSAWAEFGQVLRRLRESRNMSLREAAKVLGVSAPYLSDVELGRRRMTDDRVEQCLNLFTPDWNLLRESIVMNSIKPPHAKIGANP